MMENLGRGEEVDEFQFSGCSDVDAVDAHDWKI